MEANKIKEFASAIKLAFSNLMGTEKKFKSETLADGTVISYDGDMPMMNMPVMVTAPDGTQLPAPDGEIVLPDGSTLVIVSGVITDIKPAGGGAEAEKPAMTGEQVMNEKTLSTPQAKAIIESVVRESRFATELNEKFEAVTKENTELKAKIELLEKANEKQTEFAKQLSTAVEKLGDTPSEDTEKPKPESREERKVSDIAKFKKEQGLN